MTKESILEQIKNNLEWLEIDMTNHSINSILDELNKCNDVSMAMETIMLINLLGGLEK